MKTLTLAACLLMSLTSFAAADNSVDAEPLTLAKWAEIRPDIIAFGVELYDETGEMKPFSWVQDDDTVAAFVGAMPAEGEADVVVLRVPPQPTYVHTRDSKLYKFQIIGVEQGARGVAALTDGVIELDASLDATIAKGYGLETYSSSNNVFQKWSNIIGTESGEGDLQKFEVSRVSRSRSAVSPFDLIVYSPTIPGSPDVTTWASLLQSAKKNRVMVPAVNPAAFISGLPFIKKKGLCIRTLVFATHGFPGKIIFGRLSLPTSNIIGNGAGETDPNKFGADIQPFLCDGATIRLLTCQVAAGAEGQELLGKLADGAGVPVFGYDDFIYFGHDLKARNTPMAATRGAQWKVTPPNGTPTRVESASPKARLIAPMP